VGQVIDHLAIGNTKYLAALQNALSKAASGDDGAKQTIAGKWIVAALKSRKAPMPRVLAPRSEDVGLDLLELWHRQQTDMDALAEQYQGKQISRTGVRNPIIRLLRMNVTDCFAILLAHNEYHLPQIEERAQSKSA
jgi:hypothetical protein